VELPKSDKSYEIKNDAIIVNEPKVEPAFIPEQRVVTLPTGGTVTSEDIANQLIEQARVLNTAESTTMEMTLNPEGLGKIYLAITQKGDEITAKIFTENDAVKQALENQMANLRLEFNSNSSTKVTSIEVSVGAHEFERNLEEGQQDNNQSQQENQASKRQSRIDLNNLDELTGLMSEEDLLIAQMMQDNGNTLDYQA
jgi:flagellar hook-length control protein FliK